jgi:hypothetical protein
MADEKKGYFRLNHFHGLRLESTDFQVGERYHIEKMKLHNRTFHSHGVVPGFEDELKVVGRRRGDMSLEVLPGYAIDADGHDIFVWDVEVKTVDPGKFRLPATAYVVLKYVDEPTEFVVNPANPKYKGHRRILETYKIEVTSKEPDPHEAVELARLALDEDVTEIKDAIDAGNPGPGEIDFRYISRAGISGTQMSPTIMMEFRGSLGASRKVFGDLGVNYDLHTARDIRDCMLSAEMMLASGQVGDAKAACEMIGLVGDLEDELLEEIKEKYPDFAEKSEYLDFKENIKGLLKLLEGGKFDEDMFGTALSYQDKATDTLKVSIDREMLEKPVPVMPAVAAAAPGAEPVVEEEPEPVEAKKVAGAKEVTWEELQKLSGELPKNIYLEGKNWEMIDRVDLLKKQSEKEHEFQIADNKDAWSTNQSFKYPDGVRMTCKGRAYVGGYSQWKVLNTKPGKEIIFAKRIDYIYGGLVTDIYVDGEKVGPWKIEGEDRKYRWRNWLFRIPGEFIKGDSITMKHVAVEADRDTNMFGLAFYQAME